MLTLVTGQQYPRGDPRIPGWHPSTLWRAGDRLYCQTAGARQGMACFLEECPPSGRWLNFLEQTVSLPSYLRREVTTAGGQGHHTMSYAIQLGEARYGGSP